MYILGYRIEPVGERFYPGGIGELSKCDTSVSHLVPLAGAKD